MPPIACESCRAPLVASVRRSAGSHGQGTSAGGSPPDASLLAESLVLVPPDSKAQPQVQDAWQAASLQPTSLHEQLRTVGRLVQLAETLDEKAPNAGCGVPLCDNCAKGVLGELKRQVDEARAHHELYKQAFVELAAGEDDVGEEPLASDEDYERERRAQRQEEERLQEAIAKAKQDRSTMREELTRLQQQRDELEAEEEARHAALNSAELERQAAADEAMRAEQLSAHCERQLLRLKDVDVLRDLFQIETEGTVGSINALRLSRFAAVTIEWTETNAAIGQVVLLVFTLARLHGVTFTQHALVPQGSFSKIYRLQEPKTVLELYVGVGAANFGRLFGLNGRFERALAMLLLCVGELCAHASSRPRAGMSAQPPHAANEISAGFVGSAPEGKCLLKNLDWLLRWHAASKAASSSTSSRAPGDAQAP